MTSRTFALAAMRIVGVVSGYWLIQFCLAWYMGTQLLKSNHALNVRLFPVFESSIGLTLVVCGILTGLNAGKLSGRVSNKAIRANYLPILIGLAAAVYMTGYACQTAIQIGVIEGIAKVSPGFGGRQRASLGYNSPTTLNSRMTGPVFALICVGILGIGLLPAKRQTSP